MAEPEGADGVSIDPASVAPTADDDAVQVAPGRRGIARFRRDRVAVAALGLIVTVAALAILAPVVAPHDPLAQSLRNILQGPSSDHWLGTDQLGRDVFSRLLYAGRVSLLAALQAVGIAVAIGVPVGLLLGYFGGWVDRIAMRVVDAVMALPGLILVIAIVAVLGRGMTNAMIALGIVFAPTFVRLTRASTLAVREELHVDAARVQGYPTRRILVRHVLPLAMTPVIIQGSLTLGLAMLVEAGLSFIGLGVQPPRASWGAMLAEGASFMDRQAFLVVPPGLAITACVLSLTLLGDGLRDSIGRGVSAGHVRPSSRRPDSRRLIRVVRDGSQPAQPTGSSEPGVVLSVEGVSVEIARRHASPVRIVDDVSFEIRTGETLGVLGESGCGKSMTALAIMGLLPHGGAITSGRVVLDGVDLTSLDSRGLRNVRGNDIGMVFQEPMAALDPVFKIGDQIGESLRHHRGLSRRAARARSIELLDLVGIPDPATRVDDYPHEFSGGMAQRVMIASALACEPKLLIADEPTTALDVTIQAEILDLLHRLQGELGMSILLVTHDLGVIADTCERAVVMYAGQIVEVGTVDELFLHPAMPYTEGLLQSLPQANAETHRLAAIPGTVPSPGRWPKGCRFGERCVHRSPECETAIPLVGEGHQVRCVRVGQLELRGAQ